MASNRGPRKPISIDVQLSKAMTYVLRHGAEKEKIPISQGEALKF